MNKTRSMIVLLAGAVAVTAHAKLEMGTPFSNGAVLQRGVEVPVWGTAAPGAKVEVEFGGACVAAKAGADGSWSVKLPAMEASSEGRSMTVREKTAAKLIREICGRDVPVGVDPTLLLTEAQWAEMAAEVMIFPQCSHL